MGKPGPRPRPTAESVIERVEWQEKADSRRAFKKAEKKAKAELAPKEPKDDGRITTVDLMEVLALSLDGFDARAIATALDISVVRVNKILKDERMEVVERLMGPDMMKIDAVRAKARVMRAHRKMDELLESNNPWLASQVAQSIINADEKRKDEEKQVEVILSPAFLGEPEEAEKDPKDGMDE